MEMEYHSNVFTQHIILIIYKINFLFYRRSIN